MRAAAITGVLLAAALAGCSHDVPAPPPGGSDSGGDYLVDARGDAEPRFDIIEANFTELNGSLALRIWIQNYQEGLPLIDAVLYTTHGTAFARLVFDPDRPQPPKVKAEGGRIVDGQRTDIHDACWLPNFPTNPDADEPWWIFLEFLHNETGLTDGGAATRLVVETSDLDDSVKDEAEHAGTRTVQGGANPYLGREPECPLFHERNELY